MQAITLSRKDFRESDQLISLYTKENGKVETIARGIKKIVAKNGPALEPFSVLDIEVVPGKEKMYLTKATVQETYPNIRKDLKSVYSAGYALEFIENQIGVGVKDEHVFLVLRSFLKFLNSKKNGELLVPAFLLKIWDLQGFRPELDHCLVCKNRKIQNYFFDPSEGGLVCDKCRNKAKKTYSMTSGSVLLFKLMLDGEWGEIAKLKEGSDRVGNLVKEFVEFHGAKKVFTWAGP